MDLTPLTSQLNFAMSRSEWSVRSAASEYPSSEGPARCSAAASRTRGN